MLPCVSLAGGHMKRLSPTPSGNVATNMSPFQAYPVAFTLLLSRGAPTRSRGSSEMTQNRHRSGGGPWGVEFADDESACLAILAVDEGP